MYTMSDLQLKVASFGSATMRILLPCGAFRIGRPACAAGKLSPAHGQVRVGHPRPMGMFHNARFAAVAGNTVEQIMYEQLALAIDEDNKLKQ